MKKIIIFLLCCGVLVSTVGCGGITAPPPTDSPPTIASETAIIETPTETTPPVTAVESTEKEKELVPTESEEQSTAPTVTATELTTLPTEKETSTVTSTTEEKVTSPIKETLPSTTPQLAESETTETEPPKDEPKAETEPPKVTEPEPTKKPAPFDSDHWIAYARSYAESKGLALSDTAVECWDNPIRAGAHCIYLERDIQSRLNRYAKDEDITDVWIWAEATGNDCYDIYIGYA